MKPTVTIEYGPLTVELSDLTSENYVARVNNILDYIEANQDRLDDLSGPISAPKMDQAKRVDASSEPAPAHDEVEEDAEPGPLAPIASELRISERQLEPYFHVDPDGEDDPIVFLDEIDNLGEYGTKQTDKQRFASLLLLYVWHQCYGEDRVKSSELKNALELSGTSSSGMANMYQGEGDRLFDRRGRGPTATVKLTGVGMREARKLLKEYLEE